MPFRSGESSGHFFFEIKKGLIIFTPILWYDGSVRCRPILNKLSVSWILNQLPFNNPASMFCCSIQRMLQFFLKNIIHIIICIYSFTVWNNAFTHITTHSMPLGFDLTQLTSGISSDWDNNTTSYCRFGT